MRDYGKLYTSFWTSDDTRRLSDDGKLLAAYLLTGPHTTLIGCFRIPDGYVSEDLGWKPERVLKGFRNLSDNGFVTYNKATKWVFIHQFMKWNEIENPNQAKAAIKLYEQVPEITGLRPHIIKAFNDFAPRINTDELKPFINPSETLLKPETETETERDKPPNGVLPFQKNKIKKTKYLDSVFLTDIEYQKLQEAMGQKNLDNAIEKLDYSITVKGGKYKDHYKTIINWNNRGFLNGNGNGSGFTGGAGKAVEKAGRARSDGESWPADREY